MLGVVTFFKCAWIMLQSYCFFLGSGCANNGAYKQEDELMSRVQKAISSVMKRGVSHTFLLIVDHYLFDIIYGTDTRVLVELKELSVKGNNRDSGQRYKPTHRKTFLEAIRSIDQDVMDGSFIDFGCGKGRTLILAAKIGFKKVVGVEFAIDLCEICESNIKKLKINNADVVNIDASIYNVPCDSSVFFFFNPFSEDIFQKVLLMINESIMNNPRKAYIIYVNPVLHYLLFDGKYQLINSISSPLGQKANIYLLDSETSLAESVV